MSNPIAPSLGFKFYNDAIFEDKKVYLTKLVKWFCNVRMYVFTMYFVSIGIM